MARHSVLIKQIKSEPCTDCGKTYPPDCMDFDHIKGKKVANISQLRTAAALKEMEKCELVCSNCHRLRTMERRLEMNIEKALAEEDDREIEKLLCEEKIISDTTSETIDNISLPIKE